jgi:hypothetical protein
MNTELERMWKGSDDLDFRLQVLKKTTGKNKKKQKA